MDSDCEDSKIRNSKSLEAEWVVNLQCEVHFNKPAINKTINIEQLKIESSELMDIEKLYSYAGELGVIHGEFMKGLGKIYQGTDYLLAELNLSDLAKSMLMIFTFIPPFRCFYINSSEIHRNGASKN
ncbi:hypothetical protein AAAC51_24160 [Priestia megaterium]